MARTREYKELMKQAISINKEDDSYMNNRKLDGYSALMNSYFYMDLLKDRTGLIKNKFDKNTIKDVIFNDPATIVLWKDGTKTVVKCQKETGDIYNPELGLAMCIIKKCCGNKGNYNDVFNKWLPKKLEKIEIKKTTRKHLGYKY